ALHPLLHTNTSDFNGQRYTSTFTGEEFFLTEQRLGSNADPARKVLPAGACLEIARAALEQASAARAAAGVLELHDIVWAQPIVIEGNRSLSIVLLPDGSEDVNYEINGQEGGEEIVYFQGRATFVREPTPARLDIVRLKQQLGGGEGARQLLVRL